LDEQNRNDYCVVERALGIDLDNSFTHIPPAFLIQHGEDDSLVPVKQAYRLAYAVRKKAGNAKVIIYSGENHYFSSSARKMILVNTGSLFMNRLHAGGAN
jgi:acetyl esterase/lipase